MIKLRKRLLSILLCIITSMFLAVGVITGVLNNIYAEEHEHSFTNGLCSCGIHGEGHEGWTAITTESELTTLIEEGGNGYLQNEITLTLNTLTLAGETVNLCLNGQVLNLGGKCLHINGSGSILNLYDCTNTEHKFTPDANGIWVLDEVSGTKTVSGGVITGGKGQGVSSDAYFSGGAFYIEGGTLNMYGGNIIGNTAEWGGGIYGANGNKINISGGSVSGNATSKNSASTSSVIQYGGGIYNNSGEVNISGSTVISDNVPIGSTTSYGGGICNINGTVAISGNVKIENNGMNTEGGGIYNEGTLNITGGKIINNTANGGGGIYNQTGKLSIIDCEIKGNEAKNNSGGVYCVAVNLTLGGSTKIKDNVCTGSGTEIDSNLRTLVYDKYITLVNPTASMDIHLSFDIEAGEDVIFAEYESDISASFTSEDERCDVSFDNGDISLICGGFSLCNGDWYTDTCPTEDLVFMIYDYEEGAYIDSGYVFDGWYTDSTMGELVSKDGTTFVSPYTKFEKNKRYFAQWKASDENDTKVLTETLFVYSDGVEINGNKIPNNKIAEKLGGYGLSFNNGTVILNDSVITATMMNYFPISSVSNIDQFFGGLYIESGAKVIFNSGKIYGNNSIGAGGGVYNAGTFTMNGGEISNNFSNEAAFEIIPVSGMGGGVYTEGVFTMTGGKITYNLSNNGGGVFVADGGVFIMNDGEIIYNYAKVSEGGYNFGGGVGGGICVELGGTLKADGGIISYNCADKIASGVYVAMDTLESDEDPMLYYYCLAEGTPITLGDGSRVNIENLKEGDTIRVFDHETGKLSTSTIYNLQKTSDITKDIFNLHFTNDIDITVINSHSFFSREDNKYVTLSVGNAKDFIGKEFYNADSDSWEKLESVSYSLKKVNCYSIVSDKSLNAIANGMLSNGVALYNVLINIFEFGDGLKIDADKKQADIAKYGLWNFEEANYATKETFDALNLQYLKVAIGKGMITKEQLAFAGEYQQEHDPSLVRGEEKKEGNKLFGAPVSLTFKPMALMSTPSSSGTGVYLGGTVKIIDNFYYDGVEYFADNLFLWYAESAPKINIGTGKGGNGVKKPASGMEVGIGFCDANSFEIAEGQFANGGTVSDAQYFISDNEGYFAFYEKGTNGKSYLKIAKPVAKIGDTNYASLKDAINNIKNNETIVLLEDSNENIEIKKEITFSIDTDGHTYNALTFGNGYTVKETNEENVYTYEITTVLTNDDGNSKCLSAGAIVAIVLGSVFLLLLILYILGYFFLYRTGKLDNSVFSIIYKWLPRGERNLKNNKWDSK